jgi:hypothetical protein
MIASIVVLEVFPMKKTSDTQKPSHDHTSQTGRARKPLRLDKETLRNLQGGSRGPVVESPTTRPSQCPTMCF